MKKSFFHSLTAMRTLLFLLWLLIHTSVTLTVFSISTFSAAEAISSIPSDNPVFKNTQDFLPVTDAFSVEVIPDSRDLLNLQWTIADGYYLYKSKFKFESSDFTVGNPVLPLAEIIEDPYIGKTQIYSADFLMQLPIDMSKKITDGNLSITFQGCAQAGFCYPPETMLVPIYFQQDNTGTTKNTTQKITAIQHTEKQTITQNQPTLSIVMSICFAFLGGLILNLMPCVFPILSIKVLSFAKHSEDAHHLKLHGWVYTGGVIFSFMLIAALLIYLRAAGAAIGWGFQLQNPFFVAAMSVLFLFMSLSLCGLFDIDKCVSGFADRTHSLTHGHHFKASFFTGLLSVLVATPCTVPFMAPAIGFALTQTPLIAMSVFATLGFGLALPFLILAHQPTWIARLPKPGKWMDHLKQLLALPLFLTSIWLLWILGHQAGIKYSTLIAGCTALLGSTIWLWALGHRKAVIVLLAGVAAIYTFSLTSEKQTEEAFTQTRFDELRSLGEPVFINMTADWCITCLVNERVALSSDGFKQALRTNNVHYLKGDWTNQNAEITAFLKSFNRSGVPLYVFYPAGTNTKPTLLPQLLTPSLVINTISSPNQP